MTNEELSRARNMLKCNVLTHLESRLVLFEDIGRQMLTYGQRETPEVRWTEQQEQDACMHRCSSQAKYGYTLVKFWFCWTHLQISDGKKCNSRTSLVGVQVVTEDNVETLFAGEVARLRQKGDNCLPV